MSQRAYLSFLILICLVRGFLSPLFLYLFPLMIPWFHTRRLFEEENFHDPLSKSFADDLEIADVAFEVSSEGELEQVRPLINSFLKNNNKVEIVFSSPSVEKKVRALAQEYEGRVRILRLPLLTFSLIRIPGSQNLILWLTAKRLVLCRYDFYPELMLWGTKSDVDFILLSATLKHKEKFLRKKYSLSKFYYQGIYSCFDYIVAAGIEDYARFQLLDIPLPQIDCADLRALQILERVRRSNQTLNKIKNIDSLRALIEKFPVAGRIIMGSSWPEDLNAFASIGFLKEIAASSMIVFIAPHSLKPDSITTLFQQVRREIKRHGFADRVRCIIVDSLDCDFSTHTNGTIYFFTNPGLLCEFYTLFKIAFIGGGWGRSIHSVLEPYLAGNLVFCGPKIFRSTEYDLIEKIDPLMIKHIQKADEFYLTVKRHVGLIGAERLLESRTFEEHDIVLMANKVVDVLNNRLGETSEI